MKWGVTKKKGQLETVEADYARIDSGCLSFYDKDKTITYPTYTTNIVYYTHDILVCSFNKGQWKDVELLEDGEE